jgi:hypothetical protein
VGNGPDKLELPDVVTDAPSELVSDERVSAPIVIKVDREVAVSVTLSIGIVLSMLVFVIESFSHPTVGNAFIPLVVGPAGTLLVQLILGNRKKVCKKCQEQCEHE